MLVSNFFSALFRVFVSALCILSCSTNSCRSRIGTVTWVDKAKSLIGQISSFSKLLLLSCIWALSFSITNDDVLSPIVLWRIHLQKWLRIILNLNFRNDFNIYQSCTMKFYIYITCKLPKARFKDITRFFYQLKNTRFGLECRFLKKI